MNQDVNKIIDAIGVEWANQLVQANKKIAILNEQNGRLQQEVNQLKDEISELKSEQTKEEK